MTISKLARACCLFAAAACIQAQEADKAAAYYHYSLGHLYSEMSGAYGSRGDYFDKAADNFWAAMKADPQAGFISEELSDFYIQSGRLRDGVTRAEDILSKDPADLNARRVLARIYMRLIGDPQTGHVDETMLNKATDQLSKITAKSPGDTDSWIMLGRLYKAGQNSTGAMEAYKKALAIEPDNQDALTGLALVYSDLGDNKGAADLLKRVAEKDPSPRSLSELASAYEQMKEYALAASTLARIADQAPEMNPDLRRAMAQDLLLSNQYDEALKLYRRLAADDPKDALPELRMSQIYRQKRDFAKAREANDKARAIDPSSLEIRYNDVNLLEGEGKLPEATAALQAILAETEKKSYSQGERGNRAALVERLGLLYRANGQYEKAADAFRQSGQVDPDSAARAAAQIVDTWREAKNYSKAEEEADAAARKFPEDRLVRAIHASVLADVGKTDLAIAEAKKLVDGKNSREAYVALAQIYDKAKRYDEMSAALDAADKLSAGNDDKLNIYFLRGAMYEKQKKYDAAEAEFRKVLDIDPANASALNYLGYMLAERNIRLQEAKDFISKALDREPDNGAFLDSLGWVYFRLNRLPDAEEKLRMALTRMARDPTVHDHLGDVYFHLGKIREAIAQWQSSLKEWQSSAPGDMDGVEMAKVQKKLEGARVRLARESGAGDGGNKRP